MLPSCGNPLHQATATFGLTWIPSTHKPVPCIYNVGFCFRWMRGTEKQRRRGCLASSPACPPGPARHTPGDPEPPRPLADPLPPAGHAEGETVARRDGLAGRESILLRRFSSLGCSRIAIRSIKKNFTLLQRNPHVYSHSPAYRHASPHRTRYVPRTIRETPSCIAKSPCA